MTYPPVDGVRGPVDYDPPQVVPGQIVAPAADTATPLSGTFLLEDIQQLVLALRRHDWVDALFVGWIGVRDLADTVVDPIGTAKAVSVGWLLDHMEPLKTWFNVLAGDAGAVAGACVTWQNISARLQQVAQDLVRIAAALDGQTSETVERLVALLAGLAPWVQVLADLASAIADALGVASSIVQRAHDMVRDALARLVGSLVSAQAELESTGGAALPVVIVQVGEDAAAETAGVVPWVSGTVVSMAKLDGILVRLVPGVIETIQVLGNVAKDVSEMFTGPQPPAAPSGPTPDYKPPDLMQQLADSGEKYTPADVVFVTTTKGGQLVWLETGNDNAGLQHILDRRVPVRRPRHTQKRDRRLHLDRAPRRSQNRNRRPPNSASRDL